MTELPTLRASLSDTAHRHYGPRRRARRLPAVLVAAAGVAGLLVTAGGSADHEVAAVPAATRTPVVTPAKKASAGDRTLRSLLAPGHTLVRAWSVPDMKGHVLLSRKDGRWCLSAPDVGDGMTCGSESRLETAGLKLVVGGGSVEVARDAVVKLRMTSRRSAVVVSAKAERHGRIIFGHRPAGADYRVYQR